MSCQPARFLGHIAKGNSARLHSGVDAGRQADRRRVSFQSQLNLSTACLESRGEDVDDDRNEQPRHSPRENSAVRLRGVTCVAERSAPQLGKFFSKASQQAGSGFLETASGYIQNMRRCSKLRRCSSRDCASSGHKWNVGFRVAIPTPNQERRYQNKRKWQSGGDEKAR
jgi:hypothetical protein